jgi:metal-responsive CopG/Arc/MetJ family transcriptional regulator
MTTSRASTRKITISLPSELVEFAEEQAARLKSTRSQVIGKTLAQAKAAEEENLAAEGYRYYAQESREFAEASAEAVAEAIKHAR